METAINKYFFANGHQLVLSKTKGKWAGIPEMEVFELFYAEKIEEGFDVHQTEYFSIHDEIGAHQAFFRRVGNGSAKNAVKACGLGHDLVTISFCDSVVEQWIKNLADSPVVKLTKQPTKVLTLSEINQLPHSTSIKQSIILAKQGDHQVVATFCSNDYCFLLNAIKNNKSFPKSTTCSFTLPQHVVPRPGFESGVLNTIDEHNTLFYPGSVTLQSIFQIVHFLYINNYDCFDKTL